MLTASHLVPILLCTAWAHPHNSTRAGEATFTPAPTPFLHRDTKTSPPEATRVIQEYQNNSLLTEPDGDEHPEGMEEFGNTLEDVDFYDEEAILGYNDEHELAWKSYNVNATLENETSARNFDYLPQVWSPWFGGSGPVNRVKVCPFGSIITRFPVLYNNAGISQVGVNRRHRRVLCANLFGTLPCCDGKGSSRDRYKPFRNFLGIKGVSGAHSNQRLTRLCFGGNCVGPAGRTFHLNCGFGFRVSGYQTRGRNSINAIRFLCRKPPPNNFDNSRRRFR